MPMSQAGEALARAIVDAGRASETREGSMLAALAVRLLVVEGLEAPPPSPSPELPQGPMTPAARSKRYRDEQRRRHGDRDDPSRNVTNVTPGGRGGGLLSDPEKDSEKDTDPTTARERDASRDAVTAVTLVTQGRKVRNVTDDGANGSSVDAWCDGIASVTGRPFTRPTPGVAKQLVQCFVDRGWGYEVVEFQARAAGAAYARAFKGRTMSPFRYVEWESSGRPDPSKPQESGPVVKPPRLSKAERRDRDGWAPTMKPEEVGAAAQAALAAIGGPKR